MIDDLALKRCKGIMRPSFYSQQLKIRPAIIGAVTALLAAQGLFPPALRPIEILDVGIFSLFNTALREFGWGWAYICALTNHDAFDAAMYLAVIGYTWRALAKVKPTKRPREVRRFLLYYLYLTLVGLALKRLLQGALQLHRLSPSLAMVDAVTLDQTALGIGFKDQSHNSFPADHALFLFSWAFYWKHRQTGKPLWGALGIALGFSLPRLLVNAHWASDLFMGGALTAWIMQRIYFRVMPASEWK